VNSSSGGNKDHSPLPVSTTHRYRSHMVQAVPPSHSPLVPQFETGTAFHHQLASTHFNRKNDIRLPPFCLRKEWDRSHPCLMPHFANHETTRPSWMAASRAATDSCATNAYKSRSCLRTRSFSLSASINSYPKNIVEDWRHMTGASVEFSLEIDKADSGTFLV
jgi:hypothetical protein